MNILAIIPARSGSKGVPKKNIYPLAGKPLISYTIESAKQCKYINKIIVSTDGPEIAELSKVLGADVPFLRPSNLAQDNTQMIEVVRDLLNTMSSNYNYIPDAIVLLQPTSPFRSSVQISEAINLFLKNPEADSLVSVVKVPHHFTPESIYKFTETGFLENYLSGDKVYDRHQKPNYLARNGPAILISKKENILNGTSFYGKKILSFTMDYKSSIDIDSLEDMAHAEILLTNAFSK